jgi:hypothetical protein
MARLGGEPAVGANQPGPCAANAMSGSDLVSLYIMLGIGVAIMLYVRFLGGSDYYFKLSRETYEPTAEPAVAAAGDAKES